MPGFQRPRCSGGTAPAAGDGSATTAPTRGRATDQDGHKDGCVCLAAEAADWDHEAPGERPRAYDSPKSCSSTQPRCWTPTSRPHAEAWSSATAAVRAVRALELAVHAEVLGHIRRARESGESWGAIGELLGFGPIAAERPGPLAELAYDYSAGLPTVDPFPAPAVFRWDCPYCSGRIADHRPVKGPALDQDGHRGGCVRLAADVADWDQEASR